MNGLIAQKDLFSNLNGKNIVLDTCCLIHATKQPEIIGKFLVDLKKSGAYLLTIPMVNLEFLRDVSNIKDYKKRQGFLKEITEGYTYPIERKLEEIPEFPMVMKSVQAKADLADYLLVASLVNHPDIFLLTENHHHMPMGILDRISIIAFDNDNGIKVFGLYKLNLQKYNTVSERILSGK